MHFSAETGSFVPGRTLNETESIEMSAHGNPFYCDVRMCWLRDAEQEGRVHFRTIYDDNREDPECANYPDVEWREIPLDCSQPHEFREAAKVQGLFNQLLQFIHNLPYRND